MVTDTNWNGMIKVKVTSGSHKGTTKSYRASHLRRDDRQDHVYQQAQAAAAEDSLRDQADKANRPTRPNSLLATGPTRPKANMANLGRKADRLIKLSGQR